MRVAGWPARLRAHRRPRTSRVLRGDLHVVRQPGAGAVQAAHGQAGLLLGLLPGDQARLIGARPLAARFPSATDTRDPVRRVRARRSAGASAYRPDRRFVPAWRARNGRRANLEPERVAFAEALAATATPDGHAAGAVDLPGAMATHDRRLLVDPEHDRAAVGPAAQGTPRAPRATRRSAAARRPGPRARAPRASGSGTGAGSAAWARTGRPSSARRSPSLPRSSPR